MIRHHINCMAAATSSFPGRSSSLLNPPRGGTPEHPALIQQGGCFGGISNSQSKGLTSWDSTCTSPSAAPGPRARSSWPTGCKANHIHGWFERNTTDGYIENCELYPVCKGDLKCLMADCRKVLDDPKCASSSCREKTASSSATQRYDSDYFESLEETTELLRRVIESVPDDEELFYHAWW